MSKVLAEIASESLIAPLLKEMVTDGYLTEFIDAASHMIQISDTHPVGGMIVVAMLYAIFRRGSKKSTSE